MSWSKVSDIAYGRLRSPDLDVAEEFLTRFGLHRTERTADALYMRGTYPNHHIHVTEKGDSKFVGIAYYVDDEDDLKKLAKAPGASGVENIDARGGGGSRDQRGAPGRQARAAHRTERLSDRRRRRHRAGRADRRQAAKAEFRRS